MDYKVLSLIPSAFIQTMVMVFTTLLFASVIGFFLGVFLYYADKGFFKKSIFSKLLALTIDSIRSFPFAIFIIALLPISKFVFGTSFGVKAALIPMILAASSFFTRLSHQGFHTLPKELIDAAKLMGFSNKDIATKLLLKETLPQIALNLGFLANAALGMSTVAGLVGAGGVGKLALDYGYYRFNLPILIINIIIILIIGKSFQMIGEFGFKKLMIKRGLYGKS